MLLDSGNELERAPSGYWLLSSSIPGRTSSAQQRWRALLHGKGRLEHGMMSEMGSSGASDYAKHLSSESSWPSGIIKQLPLTTSREGEIERGRERNIPSNPCPYD
jgi:hypothetical protein